MIRLKWRNVSKSKLFRCFAISFIIIVLFFSLPDDKAYKQMSQTSVSASISSTLKSYSSFSLHGTKSHLQKRNVENSSMDSNTDNVTILCYILLKRSRVQTAKIIKDTWGSHCDKLLFFGAYEYPELPVTFLNVSEGYENLWGKAKASIIYLSNQPQYKV